MSIEIPFGSNSNYTFGSGESQFKQILDTAKNTSRLAISTYSIPTRLCDKIIRSTPTNCSIEIVTAIPGLGIDADWREGLLERIKEKRLEQILFLPLQREVSVYFLEENHSKIVITDEALYVGSANFSFGSNSNFEGGVYLRDPAISNEIYVRVFCPLMNRAKRFSGRSRDVESQVRWLVDTTECLIEILLEIFDFELCVLLQQIAGAVDNLKIAFVVHQELFDAISAFEAPTDSIRRLLEACLDLFGEDENLSWRANPNPLQRAFNHLLEKSSASNVDALASIASDLSVSEIELGSLVSRIRIELHILRSALRELYERIAEKDF